MNKLVFKPPVIAHRGACAYAPENTLASFNKAAQLGINWVEFDVMLASCGTPIVFHDETLTRTTNGEGIVDHFNYQYLRSLDAGSWFSPAFSGEHIPSLAEVMAFLKQSNISANVEIKPFAGKEMNTVVESLKIIEHYYPQPHPNILFSSFSIPALRYLRELSPQCAIGLLLHEWEKGWEDVSIALNCVSIHVNDEIITSSAAQKIKKMDKKLLVYTVNDLKRANELYQWGVDAVFSDMPDKIKVV